MAQNLQRPYGTEDITPEKIRKWHTVEQVVAQNAEAFGFREIRVPTFENTDLFMRSVGETTDVVQKEMYTVSAKQSTFTLRPEGTAGVMRSFLQNGLLNDALPLKVYYILSCFRHERPQAGRLREFHQFGIEMAGSASPYADAEVISLGKSIIDQLGLKNIELNINSIGCPKCRANYHAALKEFFGAKKDELCETCLTRLDKNPMRLLDCKSEICSEIAKDAPVIIDFLCDECAEHFNSLKAILEDMGIEFKVNPKIVRGLDYYTRTVFEFVTTDIGAQGTICGGGRYDGLIEELGGKSTPSLGFGMGLERLIMTMENQGCEFIEEKVSDLYICPMGENAYRTASKLAYVMRNNGLEVNFDLMNRGLKAQMKYANKINAKYALVLGDNEIENNCAKLKNMSSGEQFDISLDSDAFVDTFVNIYYAEAFGSLGE